MTIKEFFFGTVKTKVVQYDDAVATILDVDRKKYTITRKGYVGQWNWPYPGSGEIKEYLMDARGPFLVCDDGVVPVRKIFSIQIDSIPQEKTVTYKSGGLF